MSRTTRGRHQLVRAPLLLVCVATLAAACTMRLPAAGDDLAARGGVVDDMAVRGSSSDMTDSGDGGGLYPAPHARAPRVVSSGGRVLKSPRIIPITYDGDPWQTKIDTFVAGIGATDYWKSVAAEYGVGAATSGTPIHLAGPAPTTITDAEVRTWLAQMLDGTHPEWPLPDGNTMYAIYYPTGTSYVLFGQTGVCEDGNDSVTRLPDGTPVPYIVMPRCPAWPGLAPWDSFTWTQSHEFLEEATDPYKTAFYTDDADDVAWSWSPPLAEIGDMCDYPWALMPAAGVDGLVQRVWSTRAAVAGNDPCVPAPPGPYFNAAPLLTDDVAWSNYGYVGTTKGIKLPVGASGTVEVDLFSNAPTAPWQVSADDFNAVIYGVAPDLQLSLDRTTGKNGDKLTLTIHVLKAGDIGGSRFILRSTLAGRTTYWIGYVGN